MDARSHLLSILARHAEQRARRPYVVIGTRLSMIVKARPSPGVRTVELVSDDWLLDFLEHLIAQGVHRTWERYVAHRRRKLGAIKAHNTRLRNHIELYERICGKLEEWSDGLRVEELAVMLGEDEAKVYRTLRWAERAEWLKDMGERGWFRSAHASTRW